MQSLLIIIAGKIIAIIAGIYFFKFLSIPYRLIFYQVILALFCESIAKHIAREYHSNNIWIFNWYLLFEMWLNGLAAKFLLRNKTLQKSILYTLGFLTALWILNVGIEGMTVFANWCFIATSIVFVIIYIFVLFDKTLFAAQSIFLQPSFWLSMSIILFYGCDLPYFGLRNYLIVRYFDIANKLYYVNYVLNFIRYPLIAIAFILYGRNVLNQKRPEIA